jgi:hypothetical protein
MLMRLHCQPLQERQTESVGRHCLEMFCAYVAKEIRKWADAVKLSGASTE